MSEVKRDYPEEFVGSDPGELVVFASDYDTLAAELATVKKVAYGNIELMEERDSLVAECRRLERENKRLREALTEVAASLEWNAHGICRGINDGPIMPSAMAVDFAKAALRYNGRGE
jgi:hypothetical protein